MGSANKGSDNGLMDEITTFATDYRQPHPCWSPMAQAGSSSCPASPASQQGLQSQFLGMTIKDLPFADEAWRHLMLEIRQFAGGMVPQVHMERTCKDLHRWFYATFDPHRDWPIHDGFDPFFGTLSINAADSGDTCAGTLSTQKYHLAGSALELG